jgi:AcrR family transcriptional regulator
MPRGATKRRPRTVTALLNAALDLFADQGYGATSIPEICARAGLTKGAFYSNYANKDALFLALLDRSWAERAAWIRRSLPEQGTSTQIVHSDPSPVIAPAAVDRRWTLVSAEFSLHAIRHPDVAELLVEHERRVRAELATLIAEALEQSGRRPSIPVDDLSRMVVAVTEGSDIQVLTDAAAGQPVHNDQGVRTVTALLDHFSTSVGGKAR